MFFSPLGAKGVKGKTRLNHFSGWVGLLEMVSTSFIDPIFSLNSHFGAPRASIGRPDQVMRQNSQITPFRGGVGAYGGAQAADGV